MFDFIKMSTNNKALNSSSSGGNFSNRLLDIERKAKTLHVMLANLRLGRTSATWPQILGDFTVLTQELEALAKENQDFFRFNVLFPSSLGIPDRSSSSSSASTLTTSSTPVTSDSILTSAELERLNKVAVYLPDILSTVPPRDVERDLQSQVDEIFALYLYRMSNRINNNYYRTVLAYVIFFRECLNEYGWGKKIESEGIRLDNDPKLK